MTFQVRVEKQAIAGHPDGIVVILEETSSGIRAEICPTLGFNCFRWQVPWKGQALDLLYADPQFLDVSSPTRTGIPVLFPFPNRIRDGRFLWEGKEYRLPTNDPAGKNAIHGFAVKSPWRLVGQGADATSAWVVGEFQGAVDAPESLSLWPTDYRLRLTYRLSADSLRLEAEADNPDRRPLPFGLGYHPYFQVPLIPGRTEDSCFVQVPARSCWELEECLPTGQRYALGPSHDLVKPRPYSELNLDDLYTDLDPGKPRDGLLYRGRVEQTPEGIGVELWTSPAFEHMVLFTPPHRRAICLEPYTCITDAINLQAKAIPAGLLTLAPGERWNGVVEIRWKERK